MDNFGVYLHIYSKLNLPTSRRNVVDHVYNMENGYDNLMFKVLNEIHSQNILFFN